MCQSWIENSDSSRSTWRSRVALRRIESGESDTDPMLSTKRRAGAIAWLLNGSQFFVCRRYEKTLLHTCCALPDKHRLFKPGCAFLRHPQWRFPAFPWASQGTKTARATFLNFEVTHE